MKKKLNFALIGVAGYIAPRHIEAIKYVGGELVLAYDPSDSVGLLDKYYPDCKFYSEAEFFFLSLHEFNKTEETRIDYVAIASPNYMHFPQSVLSLKLGSNVICEKPLVGSVRHLDELRSAEKQTGKKVYPILQLRLHEQVDHLRTAYNEGRLGESGQLTYITSRGNWYLQSWKNNFQQSFGISANIGIHFFDLLCHIFSTPTNIEVFKSDEKSTEGKLTFGNTEITWHLSVDKNDLPPDTPLGSKTFRHLNLAEFSFEFSDGFTELHNQTYADIVNGKGLSIEETRESIKIVEFINNRLLD